MFYVPFHNDNVDVIGRNKLITWKVILTMIMKCIMIWLNFKLFSIKNFLRTFRIIIFLNNIIFNGQQEKLNENKKSRF